MLYIIADMNPPTKRTEPESAEREIARIKRELAALGSMHPGSVTRQYQVCGKPGCKCMDAKNPARHGPYHKLAYVHRGRPACRFVRASCVESLAARLAAYKRFRELVDRWVELSIQQGAAAFFAQSRPKGSTGGKTKAKDPGK